MIVSGLSRALYRRRKRTQEKSCLLPRAETRFFLAMTPSGPYSEFAFARAEIFRRVKSREAGNEACETRREEPSAAGEVR
jgi:hypothetical protein